MREDFDFDAALASLQVGQGFTGKDGILAPRVKQLTEAALQSKMAAYLQSSEPTNRRIGSGSKAFRPKPESGGIERTR